MDVNLHPDYEPLATNGSDRQIEDISVSVRWRQLDMCSEKQLCLFELFRNLFIDCSPMFHTPFVRQILCLSVHVSATFDLLSIKRKNGH